VDSYSTRQAHEQVDRLTLELEVLKASVSAAMAVFIAVPVELKPRLSMLFFLELLAC